MWTHAAAFGACHILSPPRGQQQPFSMEEGPPSKRPRRPPLRPAPPPFPPPRRSDEGMDAAAAASSTTQPAAAITADDRDTSMSWGHAAIHADLRKALPAENPTPLPVEFANGVVERSWVPRLYVGSPGW